MWCDAPGPGPLPGAGTLPEDAYLPVSGLAHMVYCPRRWALIHLEGLWAESRHTAEGKELHDTAHQEGTEVKGRVLLARALRFKSVVLGLTGVSDVVEFHPLPEDAASGGCRLAGKPGLWKPVPVEYKRGRPQPDDCYHVQLAAQAICLEEMTGARVETGYLFHAATRRRQEVIVDQALRDRTRTLSLQTHALHASGITPPAEYRPKCRGCSLADLCQPKTVARKKSAKRYLGQALSLSSGEESPP